MPMRRDAGRSSREYRTLKVLAVLEADFDRSPLGTRSRLCDELGAGPTDTATAPAAAGNTVLGRTIRRLQLCKRLGGICLAVHVSQKQRAEQAVAGLGVAVETHDAPRQPWAASAATGGQVAAARKWSLDAWRGGLGGFCAMDESTNVALLEAIARRDSVDAVMPVPAAASLIDPAMADSMIEHFEKIHADLRLTFAPSPPGLTAPIFLTALLSDLCRAGWPPGRTLAYRPDDPQRDLLIRNCCYRSGAEVEQACGRLIADTDRSVARLESLLEAVGAVGAAGAAGAARGAGAGDGPGPDAQTIARWLHEHDRWNAGALPREVEIELTTDDPLAQTTLRPRGERVGRRGPLDVGLLDRLFEELAHLDDSLIVLGGFGDPLRHPQFDAIVKEARRKGVFGIAVRTSGLDLDAARIDALLEANVDAVSILLDAHSPDVYKAVHGFDGYAQAVANIDALMRAQAARRQPCPFLVPEMIKTRQTLGQMEAFYDEWIRRTGAAVIVGPAAYGGPFAHLAVMNMAPPRRFPCARLWSRVMVLADGRVTVCDQDFRGEHAIGRLQDSSLGDLWTGDAMSGLRRGHRAGDYIGMSLCPGCKEWHRP
jgi:hypothetical protein